MLKRILQSTLLLFVVIIMAGAVSAAGYSGYTAYGFTSNDVTVDSGDTFDLYLEAGNLLCFGSLRFSVQFDESVFTLKRVVLNPDDEVPGYMMTSPKLAPPMLINWIHTEPYKGYANFAKLTFEVNEDVYSGNYHVSFETYSSESLYYNAQGELVQAVGELNVAAQSLVTVNGIEYTPVSSVKLNKSRLTLAEDEYETLKATVYPSDATNSKVTWSSSDTSVAKVSTSGKVTGISDGVAVIYAMADGVMTECQVTVDTPHSCSFIQKSTAEKYLKSEATCESAAKYYYSCACGNIGTETFTSGGRLDHNFDNSGICVVCGYEIHICSFSSSWEYDEERHWHECECGKVSERARHYDENTDGKCDVCRYIMLELDDDLYTISGTITSYGDPAEPVFIRVLDEDENEIKYLTSEDGTYSIELAAGSYTLEVSKKNHVTRRYSVIVGE